MRILVVSDVHLETHFDGGVKLFEILGDSFREASCDVAVVAGDLCTFRTMRRSLRLVSRSFPRTVYVLGNHECYGGSMWKALARARLECERLGNVHLLEDETLELGGRRFVGCTMWFRYPPKEGRDGEWVMNDFDRISRIRREVGVTNRMSVRFLERTVRPGDLVVTHHLPGPRAVHPRWRQWPESGLNRYYVCDVERVIRRQRPALWVHGHTHESMDWDLGETRVVCNPFGYLMTADGPDVNRHFDPAKIVEV